MKNTSHALVILGIFLIIVVQIAISQTRWIELVITDPDSTTCTESSPCDKIQNQLFTINASTTCRTSPSDDYCGNVYAEVRYNDTTSTMQNINTTKSASPFYIVNSNYTSEFKEVNLNETGLGAQAIAVGDVDGDGKSEVVVGLQSG